MEICMLCLEKSDMANSIIVDSLQWQKENVKHVIEKHLWPMDTMRQSSCLCTFCWKNLYDFHRFYVRVAEFHFKSGKSFSVLHSENVADSLCKMECKKLVHFTSDQLKTKNFHLVEGCGDSETLLEDPLPEGFIIESKNICIKEEINVSYTHKILQKDIVNKERTKDDADVEDNSITQDPLYSEKLFKKQFLDGPDKSLNVLNNKNVLVRKDSFILETVNNMESDAYSEICNDYDLKNRTKKKRKNPDEKTGHEYDKFISENFQIVCSLCHIFLDNFFALRKHFREEHNKRGFVSCCKKKIFSRPLLVDHIHIHLDPSYFKCQECDKVYSERSTLESHIKTHDLDQKNRHHTCSKCGKNFVGSLQLESHKKTHEPGYKKEFTCSECGKLFTTYYSLNYHKQAIHLNKFVNICDICGKTMRCRNQFKLHMEKHNSKESMSMNCDICGLRLTDRRGLRRHKISQHPIGGKKEYSCHLCPKVSPNQEALKTHIRLTHSTNFSHKCTMCGKAFKRSNALREHMATHTGTPLYACPWCPKTFISNGNMHNHRKKAHPLEWQEAHRKKYANNLASDKTTV